MASAKPHHNRIKVTLYAFNQEFVTTIERRPTKANVKATLSECDDYQRRLRAGEPWEEIRGELRGELSAKVGSLGYYMQIVLDTAPNADDTRIAESGMRT